jgi:small-conductance mechanosensitive channel/CRP-like cAMP-binding protein
VVPAAGLALFFTTLALRGASANRHVRGRLIVSCFAFAAYSLIGVAVSYLGLSAELRDQARAAQPLLLAFGVINAAVALVINPWRSDRLPDRFPTIVQDSIVIGLFAVAVTLILQERVFATTAVGAVVIGFALQDTLGNLFAGLAIQIEKPFRVGHWVNVAGKDGMVSEVTWRATKIRTKTGNFVIVPNSALARDTITNYSEPIPETRIEVDIGASYDTPPNRVKTTILEAIKNEPLLAGSRQPEVLLADFAASAVTYRVRVWTSNFALDEVICDRIRTAVYYAFRRAGIVIPYPIQVEMFREDMAAAAPDPKTTERLLETVRIFETLPAAERAHLAAVARDSLYAAGESIVREGDAGSSMFVVARGEMVVTLDPSAHEVARLGPGDFFGEMSLLTGAPRTASVTAVTDVEVLEITLDAFRQFVLANPAAVERIGSAVADRAAALEEHRVAGVAIPAGGEESQKFLARVRRFLGLSAV